MTLFQNRMTLLRDPNEPGASGAAPPAAPAAPADRAVEVDFEQLSKDFEADSMTDPPDTPVEPGVPDDAPAPTPPPASETPPAVPPGAAAQTPPASAPSTPAAPPSAAPVVPPVAPPQTPPAQPAQPAQPPAPAAAQPPAAPTGANEPLTPEKVEAAYKQFEQNMLPQLEQQYQLSPEMQQLVAEDPAKAIPKLAAMIHYKAQVAAYTGVMSQVPRILDRLLSMQREADSAMSKFNTRWPALTDSKFAQQVNSGLETWRKANPNMATDEMIEKAGLWLMVSLGLNPNPQPAEPPPVVPRPATPAGVGGQGTLGRPPPGGAVNIFEQMSREMESDGDT